MQNSAKYGKILITGLLLGLSSVSYADLNSLKKFETDILKQYQNKDFYENNQQIELDIHNQLAKDPASFNYDFPKLKKAHFIDIKYSPDKKLKFYNFDVSGGGTMGEWTNYVQYKVNNKMKLDSFDSGYIQSISQNNIKNQPVYLVKSYYKGDNCTGMHEVRAVQVGSQQLLKSYIFQTNTQKLDRITVDFNCSKIKDYQNMPEYMRIGPKAVDIILIDKNDVPQNKYLRYSFTQDMYKYTGIIK
ncbi:hypothetical protein RFI36_15310 [Acinetobacter gerneri]|uniref:Uncharacterized protein n=1 Tax=Acinetobacter gerneri TaxID=202952 RepID=A0AAW8JLG8_9GAMM|nr:hypothetical protein [Acinetobacter gerneri]MDQ9011072.1 hypothetical protein [Acinetobacter gerneri]MDQ9015236.1 hypothetical protein [Acinetobacter gerneri]MDQ9026379.1 hypothetical protein [Acinetobacter gerneri]MDQ9053688.1 hypothetical protein [Acinetobacter gerneri]MDQ9061279.1 hypothetical protein [Acinetobacter gerneri]